MARLRTVSAFLAAGFLILAGCDGIGDAVRTGAEIVERQLPELVEDEEDLEKWQTGVDAVKAVVGKIGTADEIAIGQGMALRTFASLGRPHSDAALNRYVAMVGRLVALQSERPGLPYWFAVVRNDTPLALALPGGYVFVSTGLLERLKSEHELAAVLGHEIAHVAQKHGLEIVLRDHKIAKLTDFGERLDEDVGEYREFIDLAYQKLVTEGYGREYEIKADLAGARYAYEAGYHPGGLLPFLDESARSQGRLQFESFKTHPDPRVRIARIREQLARWLDHAGMPRLDERYQKEALSRL
ncbi:MAG: M48 family metalloprotease [Candidatus Brocadiia bacterium]|jgi:predicted Zn-dependent protease|nr:M48 family metalloprotease [Candidatus Brocadiia bacterium]